MFTSLDHTRSIRTSIAAAAIALAACAGQLMLLDRQVAAPWEQVMATLQRPHFEEEITVHAPAAPTHFTRVR
jgi:hypothetical protein